MTDELKAVPHVDLARYLGTWYEIARKPMRHEDAAARDITATYELDDGGAVRVLNSCIDEDGMVDASEGQAKPVDASNAKLEVTFLPQGLRWIPFARGDYWILRLDEDYTPPSSANPAASTCGCCTANRTWTPASRRRGWRRRARRATRWTT